MRRGAVRGARAALAALALAAAAAAPARAQPDVPPGAVRLDGGRFTMLAYPPDLPLARALLADAVRRDSFPGLPRPRARVVTLIAPDARRFRAWGGAGAPEWGAAFAYPESGRILMQGRGAGSDAGDPVAVFRHELAHLALHEQLGPLPPRWFDEGYASYAAGEWGRDETLAASVALLVRGMPTLDALDRRFAGGAGDADEAYALAFRAVADLAALDRERGLALFFRYWRDGGRFDVAVRQAYGVTADAFERQWRERTRARYGVLALVTNLSAGTVVFLVAFLPLWISRRRRDRRRLEALRAADEAAERAARESALAALLGEPGPAAGPR